jgi:hypothetical protein
MDVPEDLTDLPEDPIDSPSDLVDSLSGSGLVRCMPEDLRIQQQSQIQKSNEHSSNLFVNDYDKSNRDNIDSEIKYKLGVQVGMKRGHWEGYQEGYDAGFLVASKESHEAFSTKNPSIVRKILVRKRKVVLDGNRIQNMPLLAQTISENMECKQCHGTLKWVDEKDIQGFSSTLIFECQQCFQQISSPTAKKLKINSTKGIKPRADINLLAVGGTTMIGKGYQSMSTLMETLGISCMSHKTFDETASVIGEFQRKVAEESKVEARKLEREILLKKGETEDLHGNIRTSAVHDGGWQKRAYNKNCNSKSGVGVVVSVNTSKILDHEVLSIDCAICKSAQRY